MFLRTALKKLIKQRKESVDSKQSGPENTRGDAEPNTTKQPPTSEGKKGDTTECEGKGRKDCGSNGEQKKTKECKCGLCKIYVHNIGFNF